MNEDQRIEKIHGVINRVRRQRQNALADAEFENRQTSKVARERFFRHYAAAVTFSIIVDDLLDAIGEPKDGLTLPWDQDAA